jgi:hypothetical protein
MIPLVIVLFLFTVNNDALSAQWICWFWPEDEFDPVCVVMVNKPK